MTILKTILKASLAIGVVAFLAHCSETRDEDVVIDQYAIDSVVMADYIRDKGYANGDLDTVSIPAPSGRDYDVIYTIIKEGDGESLDYDDIVSFNYTIRLTNDSVKVTNSSSVAKEWGIFDETKSVFYTSTKFTLSPGVWTIPSIFSDYSEIGYKNGIVAVVPKLKVGGHARMIMPSSLGFGSQDLGYPILKGEDIKYIVIPGNSVIVVDIYPVAVRKATKN